MNMSSGSSELHAFGRLVELHYAAVVSVAFATTRDLALSEDVAQETFVAAWAARGTLRDVSRVRPWLCGIARNQGKNALRRRGREIAFDEQLVSGTAPSAVDQSIEREVERDVRAALAALPRTYREPLVLFYWQEHNTAQVASALSISEQAAQRRISRGRAHLKEHLARKLEHVGTRTRSPTIVAGAVLGILATRTVARTTATPMLATRLVPVTAKSLALLAIGAATLALVSSRANSPCSASCPDPITRARSLLTASTAPATRPSATRPETAPSELEPHLARIDRKLAVMTFDALNQSAVVQQVDKRLALLEHAAHVAPLPCERVTPPAKTTPPAASAPPKPQPGRCDIVMCQFDDWKASDCCRQLASANEGLANPRTVELSFTGE